MTVLCVPGDGRDDIAVGAPLFADYQTDSVEIGSATVYYQGDKGGQRDFKNGTSYKGLSFIWQHYRWFV